MRKVFGPRSRSEREGEACWGSEVREAWLRIATGSPTGHGKPELGRPSAPVAPFPKSEPIELSAHPNAHCHALVIAVASGFNTNERTSFQGRPNFLQGRAEGTHRMGTERLHFTLVPWIWVAFCCWRNKQMFSGPRGLPQGGRESWKQRGNARELPNGAHFSFLCINKEHKEPVELRTPWERSSCHLCAHGVLLLLKLREASGEKWQPSWAEEKQMLQMALWVLPSASLPVNPSQSVGLCVSRTTWTGVPGLLFLSDAMPFLPGLSSETPSPSNRTTDTRTSENPVDRRDPSFAHCGCMHNGP